MSVAQLTCFLIPLVVDISQVDAGPVLGTLMPMAERVHPSPLGATDAVREYRSSTRPLADALQRHAALRTSTWVTEVACTTQGLTLKKTRLVSHYICYITWTRRRTTFGDQRRKNWTGVTLHRGFGSFSVVLPDEALAA